MAKTQQLHRQYWHLVLGNGIYVSTGISESY
jgi:hypothetical protein